MTVKTTIENVTSAQLRELRERARRNGNNGLAELATAALRPCGHSALKRIRDAALRVCVAAINAVEAVGQNPEEKEPEDTLQQCADCGASTAPGTPDPHVCAQPAKRISMDNGQHFVSAEEISEWALANRWDAIADAMQDSPREAIHGAMCRGEFPEGDRRTFLRRYLELAGDDLVIG